MGKTNEKKIGSILLVDDEEYVLNSLVRSLRNEPYEVATCQDPTKAIGLLEKGPFNVIVSDYRMPGMSGMDLLIEVRKRFPSVTRILLTGHADLDMAISGINEGKLFRFLEKPWDDHEVRSIIKKAVDVSLMQGKSREMLVDLKRRADVAHVLEAKHPGISKVKRDSRGAIIIED